MHYMTSLDDSIIINIIVINIINNTIYTFLREKRQIYPQTVINGM